MAELYLMTIEEAGKLTEEFCLKHYPERLEKAKKFRFRDDYLRCIGAGALLYGILNVNEDDIVTSKYGKPSDPAIKKCFSLSHSGDYVLLATDTAEVGADIQKINNKDTKVFRRACTEDEKKWLLENDREEFFTIWTLKESVMKLTGLGMSLDAGSFSVMPLIESGEMIFNDQKIYAITSSVQGYKIACCSLNPPDKTKPAVVTAGMFDSE